MKLSEENIHNFNELQRAFEEGHVCAVDCLDTQTGQSRAMICAVNHFEDGSIEFVPFALMLEGNECDRYAPPTESGDGYEATTAAAIQ